MNDTITGNAAVAPAMAVAIVPAEESAVALAPVPEENLNKAVQNYNGINIGADTVTRCTEHLGDEEKRLVRWLHNLARCRKWELERTYAGNRNRQVHGVADLHGQVSLPGIPHFHREGQRRGDHGEVARPAGGSADFAGGRVREDRQAQEADRRARVHFFAGLFADPRSGRKSNGPATRRWCGTRLFDLWREPDRQDRRGEAGVCAPAQRRADQVRAHAAERRGAVDDQAYRDGAGREHVPSPTRR